MTAIRFVDTNILLYAHDPSDREKQARSIALWESWQDAPGETAISVQVLLELHRNLTRRKKSLDEANEIVREFYGWTILENSVVLFEAALELQGRWQLSIWDALILAAAKASGASELISEDFNSGQDYGGIVARNPFK